MREEAAQHSISLADLRKVLFAWPDGSDGSESDGRSYSVVCDVAVSQIRMKKLWYSWVMEKFVHVSTEKLSKMMMVLKM